MFDGKQNFFTTIVACFSLLFAMCFIFSNQALASGACWYGDCRTDGSFCNNSGDCWGPLVGYSNFNSSVHSICVNGVNMKGCIGSWNSSGPRSSHPQNGSYCIKGDCISRPAPVNGGWTAFPGCPACAPSGYTVSRSCTNPAPANGGAYCSGSSTQTCNVPVCVPVVEDNGCLTDAQYNSITHCPNSDNCTTRIDGYRCNYEHVGLCPFKKAVLSTVCRPPIIIGGIPTGGSVIDITNINMIPIGGCDFSPSCGGEGGGGIPTGGGTPPVGSTGGTTIEGPPAPPGGGSMPTGDAGDSIDGMCPSCPSKDYSTA